MRVYKVGPLLRRNSELKVAFSREQCTTKVLEKDRLSKAAANEEVRV